MEYTSMDRTKELEIRLKAIRISPTDHCVFFRVRDGCTFALKECLYCEFAKFEFDHQVGLCKFKKYGGEYEKNN